MVSTRSQRVRSEAQAVPDPARLPPPQPQQQKRKKAEPEHPPTSPKRSRHDTNTRCRFLELPRELRDEIYKQVIWSDKSVTLHQRNFVTKTGLIGTNNQISDEFLDAVFYYSTVINTTVRNHNFAHVVTFLNRLSEAQLEKFKSEAAREGQRRLGRKIRITLTYSNTKQSTRPQLNRWLDRFDDPNRRGADIQIEYVLDRASWGNGGYKQRPRSRATAGERSEEERSKMLRAMRHASSGWMF